METKYATPISYVTYTEDGTLDGSYVQVPPDDHIGRMIEVDDETRASWVLYRANEARDGVELAPERLPLIDLAALKAARNDDINRWRAAANFSTFPFGGKRVACDQLSRSDLDGVVGHIALFGAFPEGFPGGWKALDNTMIPLADVDAFRAMYAAMTAQGTANFAHAQALKAQLAAATTPDEIAAVVW